MVRTPSSNRNGQAPGSPVLNGHAHHDPGDRKAAEALNRLINRRRISPESRATLEEDSFLSELLGFISSREGLDPAGLRAAIGATFFDARRKRHSAKIERIQSALRAVYGETGEDDPGDEPEPEPKLRPFVCAIKGVTEFVRADFRLTWAVKRALVLGQPALVGAPKKSLKTTFCIDLCVSLASATPFLNEFEVPVALPTLFLSGESGGRTIQETLARICKAKGISGEDLEGNLFIGDALPQLGVEEDMAALAEFILANAIKVVIIDPLYLCLIQATPGRRLDPANLFDMGPMLLAVAKTCLAAGATPILVHHFRKASLKNGPDPNELPELEDLAYAGVQEFARQWLLFKRQERYEPGSGIHRLWGVFGGSSGHSSEWSINISEGQLDDNFEGRRWEVDIRPASEARQVDAEAKVQVKADRETERLRAKEEVAAKRVRDDAVTALGRLQEVVAAQGRPLTKAEFKDSMHGWNSQRFSPAFAFLIEHKMIDGADFEKKTEGRGSRRYEGFRPSQTDSRTQPDLNGRQPDSPAKTPTVGQPDSRTPPPLVEGGSPDPVRLSDGVIGNSIEGEKTTHKNPPKRRNPGGES